MNIFREPETPAAFAPQRQRQGLQVQTIDGPTSCGNNKVQSGDKIVVHYHGTLTDGTVFDSSYERNQPFNVQIGVGKVIKGWDQGIVGMCPGEKRQLIIPPELGYGDRVSVIRRTYMAELDEVYNYMLGVPIYLSLNPKCGNVDCRGIL